MQHEDSRGSFQRRNRPLRHVPVGASSPKPVQCSKEGQVKSVLLFYRSWFGSTLLAGVSVRLLIEPRSLGLAAHAVSVSVKAVPIAPLHHKPSIRNVTTIQITRINRNTDPRVVRVAIGRSSRLRCRAWGLYYRRSRTWSRRCHWGRTWNAYSWGRCSWILPPIPRHHGIRLAPKG